MVIWALLFLCVAIVMGVLGFAGIGIGVVAGIAKILFILFIILFIASFFISRKSKGPQ